MTLTIGQLASAAAVNVQTIRYYERRGLLAAEARTDGGYRQFADDTVRRLRFVRHAQELGFSLKEISELLALRVRNHSECARVEARTRHKIDDVARRIRELHRIRRTLERLAARCASRRSTDECPILEALEDDAAANP